MKDFKDKFVVPGIPDELFLRGKVPMTKCEVRVVTLSKSQIQPDDLVWDIGAGTGSISVEAALMASEGKVFAVEKNPQALELIAINKEKFVCSNLEIVNGVAPEVLKPLPSPNKVIIGGSGGNLLRILQLIDERLLPGGRVVINAIALETLTNALNFYQEKSNLWKQNAYKLEVVQLSIAKGEEVANLTMMKGYNPIYIITAEKLTTV